MTSSLALALRGRTVLVHSEQRPAFAVGRGAEEVAMNRGNFRIRDHVQSRTGLAHLSVAGDELRFAAAAGEAPALVWGLETGPDSLRLTLRHAAPGINRVWLTLPAEPNERVRGGGEQFSYLDLRGRRFPLWTSEPGVGRDPSSEITRAADREAGAGGDYWTTTYPQPTFLSDRLHAVHVETTAYAAFDFTAADRHVIETWAAPEAIHFLAAPDHAGLVRRLSDLFGRAPGLPAWAMEGAIVGLKDGTRSFERLERILEAGAAVSGLWCEDWAGVRETSFGTRLFWDWRWSERRYPRLPERIADLARRNIRFLAYANPYLAVDGTLYPEARAGGFFARDASGGPYNVDFGEFQAGVVDFTNEDAASWFAERILGREMLDLGIAGWMADFGEYLPTDTHLARGEAMLAHNAWPTLWAGVNARALAAHPRGREAMFFMRAGYTGIQRFCPLLWGGDQCVDFSRHDGLRTTITAALSAGLVGNRFHHSDIGGYTSLYGLVRTPELLRRWTELAAFTPVMRTHEGNRPRQNLQIDADPAVLAAFARFSRLHRDLAPYLREVARQAATGLPAQRPLFLHFPQDPEAAAIEDAFLLGADLLVAPVHAAGRDRWEVYLPAGADWQHLWSGARHRGGQRVVVAAPLGQPPVFSRLGSPHAALFGSLAAAGVAAASGDGAGAPSGRSAAG
ncbi:MAG: alpha-glucosidase [Rhodospirillales bacterium]|nr:alpha-glucosidase [Rhodospirillales bacterium]